ncbi:MAG: hypothetical protein WD278_18720 [Pirellulales bacterium]
MRLTLRTMLAYLDDILEPADAQDVGKKIEESEFATSLLHRTRDVTRRLRLAAPKLEGRGMGLDPNTVAEYLDNTLPAERVPDFEKVCLESDVHLAEVASAHQILALVLGEPAEVDSHSRQRMYGLVAAAADKASAVAAAHARTATNGSAAEAANRRRAQPEVPDYLRESSGRGRRMMAAAIVVAVLGVGLMAIFSSPALRERLSGKAIARKDASTGDTQPAGRRKSRPATKAAATGALSVPPDRTSPADPHRPEDDPAGRAPLPDDLDPAEQAGDEVADVPTISDQTLDTSATGTGLDTGSRSGTQPGELESPDPDQPAPSDSDLEEPPVPVLSDEPLDAPPGDEAVRPGEASAAPAAGIGRLISEQEVLLRLNAKDNTWKRLPIRETVYDGDRLLALPTFRPNVALAVGITMQLIDNASVELHAPDGQGIPGITVLQGRVVLFSVARPDARIRLKLGDHQGVITFGQDDATIAVEVLRHLIDGADPEASPPAASLELYVTRGQILWLSPGGSSQVIDAPAIRPLIGAPGAAVAAAPPDDAEAVEMPSWITSPGLDLIAQGASVSLQQISPERATSLTLKELAAHRRVEVRKLAVLCLAAINEFEPVLPLLGDDKQKSFWPELTASVREAMARGPEEAALVRQALEQQRGAQAAVLYRMLWGYTPEQLASGEGRQLVRYLEHPDLDIRVLSFWNLQRATGMSLGYRPEQPPQFRQSPVKTWQQRLAAGLFAPR